MTAKRFLAAVLVIGSSVAAEAIAGMKDVPNWLRGTQWTGYCSGCGNAGRANMEVTVYDDARYILRFSSRYGNPQFDGYYGGYLNYDAVVGSLHFNPEQDVSWFSRPQDNRKWSPAAMKVWSLPWGYAVDVESFDGKVDGCGTFHLNRVRR